MRPRFTGVLQAIVALTLAIVPAERAYTQGGGNWYHVPQTQFTGMLSHPRYESGGWYTAILGEYVRLSRPLEEQPLLVRGFLTTDTTITGTVGDFIGSGQEALNVSQLRGPGSFTPGHTFVVGYRFENGIALQASWTHIYDITYTALAGLIPPGFDIGQQQENTFLTANVVNTPAEFAGQDINVILGGPGSTFGIWNAASFSNIEYRQQLDIIEIKARVPIWETEDFRFYGLIGPRAWLLYERFLWRTVDADTSGQAAADTIGWYTNKIHNHIWGVFVGCGSEHKLFDTPYTGVVSCYCDLDCSLSIDMTKSEARWETEDFNFAVWRSRKHWSMVPGFKGSVGFMWYPYEAIQVSFNYNYALLFNTITSPRPVDMNIGTNDPQYDRGTFRSIEGFQLGVSFVF